MRSEETIDLRGLFHRRTLLIDDGAILELDANFSTDRVRRVLFERVRLLTVSATPLYGRIFVGILVTVFGLLLFIPAEPFIRFGFAPFVLVVGLVILALSTFSRRCRIRIEQNVGPTMDVVGNLSARKLSRFAKNLRQSIRQRQAELRAGS